MPDEKAPSSGAFLPASLMYFCSGQPMHFCCGVDTLARTRRRSEPRSAGLSRFLTTEKPTPCEKSDCQVYGILVVARRFTYCGAGKCRFSVRRKWRRVFEATGLTQSRRASLAEEAKLPFSPCAKAQVPPAYVLMRRNLASVLGAGVDSTL